MEKTNKVHTLLDYMTVSLMIYLSGSIYLIGIYYQKGVLLIGAFVLLTFFIKNFSKRKFIVDARAIILILMLLALMLLTVILENESNVGSYVAIAIQLAMAYLAFCYMDYKNFKMIFTNIMLILAAISLICFLVFQIYPQVALYFPKTEALASTNYYNAIIYVFQSPAGYSNFTVFSRNNGIFWEPGAYQAFLNVALLFLLDRSKEETPPRHFLLKVLLLAITVFTTFSTNGYLILGFIALAYIKRLGGVFHKKIYLFILFASVMILIYLIRNLQFDFAYKMADEFANGGEKALQRIALDRLKYMFYDNHFYFFGMSFSRFLSLNISCWNSIIHTMITLGIPFTAILLYGYFRFSVRLTGKPLVWMLVLLMIFSTETLFWRPIFLYLIFAGLGGHSDERVMALQHHTPFHSSEYWTSIR